MCLRPRWVLGWCCCQEWGAYQALDKMGLKDPCPLASYLP